MVAMLFILFDIEVVFLYPVGVILYKTGPRKRQQDQAGHGAVNADVSSFIRNCGFRFR